MSLLNDDVVMSVCGVVHFGGGFMHADTFKKMFSKAEWNELVSRSRIICEFDEEEGCCSKHLEG